MKWLLSGHMGKVYGEPGTELMPPPCIPEKLVFAASILFVR